MEFRVKIKINGDVIGFKSSLLAKICKNKKNTINYIYKIVNQNNRLLIQNKVKY